MLVALIITTFILGMIAGAITLAILAWNFNKKEKTDGSKKENV